ncbi:MAG: hypothetical protein CL983_05395 [Euryarchaeota archaeon]|nr:hypothetical protein [Euryarchaeota archaeon]|tara:strand:- start:20606 stop:21175 length:570 start_codon:yes stop_codon:yes gene_type:complete
MSTISSGLMTALMMVLSSVFGVVAIDGVDALTEERFVPQEKLDRAILKITNELMMIDACLASEECTVDSVELNEKRTELLDKLEQIDAYILNPTKSEKPELRKHKKMDKSEFEDLTYEEYISNKIMKLNDKLMIIDACQAAEECTVDEDILTKKENHLNMDLEKLNYCVENIEECESHKKDSKHKKYRK